MCIGFPGKILSIDEDNMALLDVGGSQRSACLDIVDEPVKVGDYVICHAGFAINRLDEATAKDKLDLLDEMIQNEIY